MSKICEKRVMEMPKKIYLETLKSVLGRSILHYSNQLQVLYIRTLGNIQGKFSTEAALLKCITGNFFLEICTSSRRTCKKHPLENYILAYHRANKDHAKIF